MERRMCGNLRVALRSIDYPNITFQIGHAFREHKYVGGAELMWCANAAHSINNTGFYCQSKRGII